jgi:hypothetical protein
MNALVLRLEGLQQLAFPPVSGIGPLHFEWWMVIGREQQAAGAMFLPPARVVITFTNVMVLTSDESKILSHFFGVCFKTTVT